MSAQVVVLNSCVFPKYNKTDIMERPDTIQTIPIDVVSQMVSLRKSQPVCVFVNHTRMDSGVNSYKEILLGIYKTIGKQTLLRHTILNITTDVSNEMGYTYYNDLGISIQAADELRMVNEMFRWMNYQEHYLELFVKLRNGEIIKIVW